MLSVSQEFITTLMRESQPRLSPYTDRAMNRWLVGDENVFPLGKYPVACGKYYYTDQGLLGPLKEAIIVDSTNLEVVASVPPSPKNTVTIMGTIPALNLEDSHFIIDNPKEVKPGRILIFNDRIYLSRDATTNYLWRLKDGQSTLLEQWTEPNVVPPYFIGSAAMILNGRVILVPAE